MLGGRNAQGAFPFTKTAAWVLNATDDGWDDIADLSDAVPLLCRIYPNGLADVNHFHAAGGMGF